MTFVLSVISIALCCETVGGSENVARATDLHGTSISGKKAASLGEDNGDQVNVGLLQQKQLRPCLCSLLAVLHNSLGAAKFPPRFNNISE